MKINNVIKLFVLLLISSVLFSCAQKKEQIAENEYYVCSMDPQVMEKQPGLCPICKMPLAKTVIDKSDMHLIKLSEDQMKLANIKVDSVHSSSINRENMLTGIFNINQNKTEQISARINGRIEQLYFKILGEKVNKGDKLYDLYSRELLLAQEEYLLVFEKAKLLNNDTESMISSSKNKLQLWGLNGAQIKELEVSRQTSITNTIYSNETGVITEIPLKEGGYVNEGTTIYRITDLSSLWVEAQVYSNELNFLEEGKRVDIIPQSYPNERIQGTVTFTNPELQQQSKINLMRVEIDNSKMLFRPGMQAYVILQSDEKEAIVLPSDALIRNSNSTIVWIETEKGKFEPRMVTIGIQNKDNVEVLSGIKPGDKVVVSGAYLLNSEFIFKRGVQPGMDHHNMKM